MRIISGQYRGRQIQFPGNLKARPTTDFAKESLFNILNNHFDFEGLTVLDLFSGTGSIALEFASRGASRVLCLEMETRHANFIRDTSEKLGAKAIQVIRADFFKYISKVKGSYDLIFADPPYDHEHFAEVVPLVLQSPVLKPEGWFILEHSGKHHFNNYPEFFDERNYGSVHFSFFSPSSPTSSE